MDSSLVLYLPFDDPDGTTAYDYSTNRADATLSDGATFVKDGYVGKALYLNGGDAQTATAIPLTSDFTLTMKVKTKWKQLGFMLTLSGLDNYLDYWMDVTPDTWVSLIFVKTSGSFKAYVDNRCVYSQSIPSGTVKGFSVMSPCLGDEDACVDDLRLYSTAMSLEEVMALQYESDDVEYYVDGINFKDYGVYVSQEVGLTGRLAQKESLSIDYDNYHGITRHRSRKRYKERTITLECFIEAKSRAEFVQKQGEFFALFDGDGTRRLKVEYNGISRPLCYEVDLTEEVEMSKVWSRYNSDLNVGTFKLKLQEDEPVKKVLRHIATTANDTKHPATITLTTTKMVNVYWGDGSVDYNVKGTAKSLSHTYAEAGEYEIVITGVIEDITDFATNAILLWDILK